MPNFIPAGKRYFIMQKLNFSLKHWLTVFQAKLVYPHLLSLHTHHTQHPQPCICVYFMTISTFPTSLGISDTNLSWAKGNCLDHISQVRGNFFTMKFVSSLLALLVGGKQIQGNYFVAYFMHLSYVNFNTFLIRSLNLKIIFCCKNTECS